MKTYLWRCGKLYAHMDLFPADHTELMDTPEGREFLLTEIENLMGKVDHEHIFEFNLGTLTLKDVAIYDCIT